MNIDPHGPHLESAVQQQPHIAVGRADPVQRWKPVRLLDRWRVTELRTPVMSSVRCRITASPAKATPRSTFCGAGLLQTRLRWSEKWPTVAPCNSRRIMAAGNNKPHRSGSPKLRSAYANSRRGCRPPKTW